MSGNHTPYRWPHFFSAAFALVLQGQCMFTAPSLYIWPHTFLQCCVFALLQGPCAYLPLPIATLFFSAAFALLQGQCAYLPLPIATLLQCCICPSSGPMFSGVYTLYIIVCVYKIYVYIGMYYTI